MEDRCRLIAVELHRPHTSLPCPPRFPIGFPFVCAGSVGGHHSDIISRNISRKQGVKSPAAMLRQDQAAGEILILGVSLDYLIGLNCLEDHLAWNIPPLQAHVDMVGP